MAHKVVFEAKLRQYDEPHAGIEWIRLLILGQEFDISLFPSLFFSRLLIFYGSLLSLSIADTFVFEAKHRQYDEPHAGMEWIRLNQMREASHLLWRYQHYGKRALPCPLRTSYWTYLPGESSSEWHWMLSE